jgi:hypothetical protein
VRLDIAFGGEADPATLPWTLDDDSIDEAVCPGCVHRLVPVGGARDGLVAFMAEAHRVLRDGATLRVTHPYAKTDRAFEDPTAARAITDATWWYFDREWREREGVGHDLIASDFEVVSIDAPLRRDWDTRSAEAQAFALRHYWNVVDLEVVLRARKG